LILATTVVGRLKQTYDPGRLTFFVCPFVFLTHTFSIRKLQVSVFSDLWFVLIFCIIPPILHSGMHDAPEQLKLDWFLQTAEPNVNTLVLNAVKENNDLETTLAKLDTIFPTLGIEPHQGTGFLLDFETLMRKMSPEAWTDQDKILSLISKLHPKTFQELSSNPSFRPPADSYSDLKAALHRKVQEDWATESWDSRETLKRKTFCSPHPRIPNDVGTFTVQQSRLSQHTSLKRERQMPT